MKKIGYVVILLVGIVLGYLWHSVITYIPRETLTVNRMLKVERALRVCYGETGKLPVRIDDGSLSWQDRLVETTDGYGNPIEYLVSNETEVVLRSQGCFGRLAKVKGVFEYRFNARSEPNPKR